MTVEIHLRKEKGKTHTLPRVTIDTNCIIDLEQRSRMGTAVTRLVQPMIGATMETAREMGRQQAMLTG